MRIIEDIYCDMEERWVSVVEQFTSGGMHSLPGGRQGG
ncbi:hypothetical protein ASZ90_015004 [hydrocarbon metagenome]|uniref:Uncharacterized protein n=1 Tax=hydrocarbon metagenome TaxID=938273 RepID=A0A0W8F441_9ZZZZ